MKKQFLTKHKDQVLEVKVAISRYIRGGNICLALTSTNPGKIIPISMHVADANIEDNCIVMQPEHDEAMIECLKDNGIIDHHVRAVDLDASRLDVYKLTDRAYDALNAVTKYVPNRTILLAA